MWQHDALVIVLALCTGIVVAELDTSELCRNLRLGDVVPNPLDCGSYFICDIEKSILKPCDNGLHFDAEHKVCNWPERANCKYGVTVYPVFNITTEAAPTTAPTTTTNDTPSSASTIDSSTNTTPDFGPWDNLRLSFGAFSAFNGQAIAPMQDYDPQRVLCLHRGAYFLPHPRSCLKYYLCAFGHLLMHQCGPGTVWNYLQSQCVLPQEAKCYANIDDSTTAATITTTPTDYTATVCYPVYTTLDGTTITTWHPTGSGATRWTTMAATKPLSTGYTPTPPTQTATATTNKDTRTTAVPTTADDIVDDEQLPNCGEGVKYLGDVRDCTHYFICIQKIPVGMYCPEGSYWDYKGEFCTSKARAQCLSAQF